MLLYGSGTIIFISAILLMLRNQNIKYIQAFKKTNTIGIDNAKPLEELGIKKNMILKRLLFSNIVAEENQNYYITTTKRYQKC